MPLVTLYNGYNIGPHLARQDQSSLVSRIHQAREALAANNKNKAAKELMSAIDIVNRSRDPNLFYEVGELIVLCRQAKMITEANQLLGLLTGFQDRFVGTKKDEIISLVQSLAMIS